MSFYAKNFIYDGQSSEIYGLVCASTQGAGETLSSAGSNIAIQEEYVLRRETPYFYGVSFPEKLQFEVEFYRENPIPRQQVSEIEKWLFGLSTYKEFEVIQEDMENIHFNSFFINPTVSTVGNEVRGFHATCVCDAPWGWGEEITYVKTNVSGEFTLVNTSDNTRYTKPTIRLIFNSPYASVYMENMTLDVTEDEDWGYITALPSSYEGWGSVTVIASETEDWGDLTSYSSNAMVFDDVVSGEIIDINTDIRYITSTEEDIVDRFNGKYMYLTSGENTISVSETVSRMEITYIPARKVGS